MKRIAIMGCPGSGKSTLARALGERLGLPVYHLDAIYWLPGWTESDYEVFRPKVQEILAGDEWIVDGGYSNSDPEELRYTRVDALILFDRSVWLCLWRVIKRVAMYRSRTRPDMGDGCNERVDLELLRYIWNYRRNAWPKILERVERHGTPVVFVRSDPDVDALVEEINALRFRRTEELKAAPKTL